MIDESGAVEDDLARHRMTTSRIVLLTARVPPSDDNIGRYTYWLAAALAARGQEVQLWNFKSPSFLAVDGVECRSFACYHSDFMKVVRGALAMRRSNREVLLLQYNPFLYGIKGLPFSFCLLPLFARMAGCRVVTVLHELCYPPGRDPRSWIWAVWQRAALWFILLATDGAIVTSPARRRFLQGFLHKTLHPHRGRLSVCTIPVGSNIVPCVSREPGTQPLPPTMRLTRIGTFYNGLRPASRAQVTHLSLQLANRGVPVQIILIGAPPALAQVRPYHPEDERPGLVGTPYLPDGETSRLLSTLDVFLALYDAGASGRHTSIAAAFAHSLCVLSTQARDTDPDLFRHGENCWLIPYGDDAALLEATLLLLNDASLRARLGAMAYRTYEQRLSWSQIAHQMIEAVRKVRSRS